jgi:hypothetical protein
VRAAGGAAVSAGFTAVGGAAADALAGAVPGVAVAVVVVDGAATLASVTRTYPCCVFPWVTVIRSIVPPRPAKESDTLGASPIVKAVCDVGTSVNGGCPGAVCSDSCSPVNVTVKMLPPLSLR